METRNKENEGDKMKHKFTKEEQSKGGKNQPREVKSEAGKKGFETTCERYPYMARHWLPYAPGMKKANGRFKPQ